MASVLGLGHTLVLITLHQLVLLHGVLVSRVLDLTVDAFLTLRLLVLQSRVGERLAHVYTVLLASSTFSRQCMASVFVREDWTARGKTELLQLPGLRIVRAAPSHWNFLVVVSIVLRVAEVAVPGLTTIAPIFILIKIVILNIFNMFE